MAHQSLKFVHVTSLVLIYSTYGETIDRNITGDASPATCTSFPCVINCHAVTSCSGLISCPTKGEGSCTVNVLESRGAFGSIFEGGAATYVQFNVVGDRGFETSTIKLNDNNNFALNCTGARRPLYDVTISVTSVTGSVVSLSGNIEDAITISSDLTDTPAPAPTEPCLCNITGSPTAITSSPTTAPTLSTGSPSTPPTTQPTPAPTYESCQGSATGPYNVLFSIDESSSVGYEEFLIEIDLVKELIATSVDPSSTVAAWAFGSRNDEIWQFQADQTSRDGVLQALEDEKADYAGVSTDIYNALRVGIDQFANATLPYSSNMLFVLTDGKPKCRPSDVDCEPFICSNASVANELRTALYEQNVKLIIIGVGVVRLGEVSCLVQDEETDTIMLKDFSYVRYAQVEAAARQVLCPTIATSYAPVDNEWLYGAADTQVATYTAQKSSVHTVLAVVAFLVCCTGYSLKQSFSRSNKKRVGAEYGSV